VIGVIHTALMVAMRDAEFRAATKARRDKRRQAEIDSCATEAERLLVRQQHADEDEACRKHEIEERRHRELCDAIRAAGERASFW
jgi:hypothetical protein